MFTETEVAALHALAARIDAGEYASDRHAPGERVPTLVRLFYLVAIFALSVAVCAVLTLAVVVVVMLLQP